MRLLASLPGHVLLIAGIGASLAACDGGPAILSDAGVDATCTSGAACDDGIYCNGVEVCASGACAPGAAPCATGLRCDEVMDACIVDCAVGADLDGDGVDSAACGGDDCDDAAPSVHPGASEVCDAADVDEDCDTTTFGDRDADADGYVDAACCNGATCGDDCDDGQPATSPEGAEVCNGVDDDCNGSIDEGVLVTFHADADGDGFGDADTTTEACAAPSGHVANARDCDDTVASTNPGAFDRCSPAGVDDDCSGTADDPAGGCTCTGGSRACPLLGACAGSTQLCVDGQWSDCAIGPVSEICGNAIDDNCDGVVDDGCACTGTVRVCGTAVGECMTGLEACLSDGTWGPCSGAIEPAAEDCDGRDDDCDGSIDEGVGLRCWADADGDGVAVAGALSNVRCGVGAACPSGETSRDPATGADCSDADARAFPGQAMAFNDRPVLGLGSYDYDCNGTEERVGLALPYGSCPEVEPCGSATFYVGAPPCGGWGTVGLCFPTGDSGRTCMRVIGCSGTSDCPGPGVPAQACR